METFHKSATLFAMCELDLACTYAMRRSKLAAECAKKAIRLANLGSRPDLVIQAALLLEAL